MRGRKPTIANVVPMRSDHASAETVDALDRERERRLVSRVRELKPRGLSKDLQREWERVAFLLAEPTVDRLKPRFVDVITEYAIATLRLRKLRAAFDKLAEQVAAASGQPADPLAAEVYRVKGRNGDQVKGHPYVAQIHETWREWRSLVAMLGLSPADERNMLPGQGDLFDESEREFA